MSYTDFDFPHTSLYESDLREILAELKKLKEIVNSFVSVEQVRFADPILWNIATQYSKNTIVLSVSGDAYLSKQPVPAGVQLNNEEYWQEIFNFADYVRTANENLTINVEQNTTRSEHHYNIDDWLLWDDVLYKVIEEIEVDDLLVVDTNVEHFTVEDFIKAWIRWANATIQQYKDDIDASELAYRQQLAQDIADTTASLQAQLNLAISGATVDSEVINARLGADGVTYDTLGDAIRTQVGDLHNEIAIPMEFTNKYYGKITLTSGRIATEVVGETLDPTVIASDIWVHAIIPCSEGDIFILTLDGRTQSRPYNVVDENYEVLQRAGSLALTNYLLRIPTNGAYLIVNNVKENPYAVIKSIPSQDYIVNASKWIDEINTQQLSFDTYPLANTNIVTLNYGNKNRAHSRLYRASENIIITPHGIPNDFILRMYTAPNLTTSIAGTNVDITNGEEVNILKDTFYRFVFFNNNDPSDDPTVITSVYLDIMTDKLTNSSYDIIMFAGQSNMAGRGKTNSAHPETAPSVIAGAGYEFKAATDQSQLYPITEPFGYDQNKSGGIDDSTDKTGDCIPAFVNAYFTSTHTPIIAISASEGGTSLNDWVQGYDSQTGRLYDACTRLEDCITYCNNHNIEIRHVYVVWLQGESDAKRIYDGEAGYSIPIYVSNFETCQQAFIDSGAEKLLVIRIGQRADSDGSDTGLHTYDAVIEKQTELCTTDNDLVMICTDLAGMRARSLMKDQSHYYQDAYNEFGTYAGVNAAIYADRDKEPTMYDTYYSNLYYSHKN